MAEPTSRGALASRVMSVARTLLLTAIVGYIGFRIYAGRSTLASLQVDWNLPAFAGALASAIIAYQCLFLGWLILLRRSGFCTADRIDQYLRVWWVSFLYRYVPGKLLLIVERARMGSEIGIPIAAGAALTIVESLLSILAGAAVSLLAVSFYVDGDARLLGIVLFLLVAAVLLFPLVFRALINLQFIKSRYPELGAVALGRRDILVSVLPYVFHYLLLGLSFFLVSRSLQLFTWSDLPGLCGIYALSHVLSLVALVAPGGLGVREGAIAVQLARFVPAGLAEALAVGIRIWFTAIELFCYFAVLLFCRRAASSRARFK